MDADVAPTWTGGAGSRPAPRSAPTPGTGHGVLRASDGATGRSRSSATASTTPTAATAPASKTGRRARTAPGERPPSRRASNATANNPGNTPTRPAESKPRDGTPLAGDLPQRPQARQQDGRAVEPQSRVVPAAQVQHGRHRQQQPRQRMVNVAVQQHEPGAEDRHRRADRPRAHGGRREQPSPATGADPPSTGPAPACDMVARHCSSATRKSTRRAWKAGDPSPRADVLPPRVGIP